ncbi:MAG: TIGR03619 family F420-dependent LLM class oxidoreductase [Gammaproteobacteria bacterium]
MKIGLNIFPVALEEQVPLARLAEELGYHSLWYGEHIALPAVFDPAEYPTGKPPFDPRTRFLDPFALFTHLAAATRTIRFGTGIVILPLRDLFTTARTIVTVDRLSGGRLDLGVGVGSVRSEYGRVGRRWETRGAVLDEFLAALDRLWSDATPEFHGRHFDFGPIGFEPKPVQAPRVPVHAGGFTEPSLRRAARCDGWYGLVDSPEQARATRDRIEGYRREYGTAGRPFELTLLFLFSAPPAAQVADYEAAGVDQIVVTPWVDWKRRERALPATREYAAQVGLAGR